MNMAASSSTPTPSSSLSSFFLLFLAVTVPTVRAGIIGVDYGRDADNIPSPSAVVSLLKGEGVNHVKIYDTDHTVLDAFKNSGISLIVGLGNDQLSQATNQQFTDNWVATNIVPYYPATTISAITVGNEVINQQPNLISSIVPAMRNLLTSLQKNNIGGAIKISSPFPFNVLGNSYPPSKGSFRSDLVQSVINPLLDFLDETSSPLMINIYPYVTYSDNQGKIPLDYATFGSTAQGITDPNTGLHYSNLLDAQIDAIYSAVSAVRPNERRLAAATAANARRRPNVVITETGWPHIDSSSNARSRKLADNSAFGATTANSAAYNRNLVKRVLTGGGTPLVPDQQLEVYIFSLFNEDLKKGDATERNFGLFYPNGQKVYDINLSGSSAPTPTTGTTSWCVAKGGAPRDKLQQALDYACGQVDCRPISSGGNCYEPNTLEAHASWAFNRYYQDKSHAAGTCDFSGVATVTFQQPKFGNCVF